MKNFLTVLLGVLLLGSTVEAGEIVKRSLGTDEEGNAIEGYVFQAGRSYRGRTSSSYYNRPFYLSSRNSPIFIPSRSVRRSPVVIHPKPRPRVVIRAVPVTKAKKTGVVVPVRSFSRSGAVLIIR